MNEEYDIGLIIMVLVVLVSIIAALYVGYLHYHGEKIDAFREICEHNPRLLYTTLCDNYNDCLKDCMEAAYERSRLKS